MKGGRYMLCEEYMSLNAVQIDEASYTDYADIYSEHADMAECDDD